MRVGGSYGMGSGSETWDLDGDRNVKPGGMAATSEDKDPSP